MELRTLRYFAVVAEEMHFGRAATRLHISQPPLSRQMMNLEEELEVALFDRTKRGIQLTEAGALFLEEVTKVISAVDAATTVAKRAGRGEMGRLTVGFFVAATYAVLPKVIRQFRKHSANVNLVLQDMELPKVIEGLIEGVVDVGFVRPPITDHRIAFEVLLREPFVAAIPDGHRFARRSRLHLRDLADEQFVMFAPQWSVTYAQIINACHASGFQPRIVQEARRAETVVGLVSSGVGISLMPASARALAVEGVSFKRLDGLPMSETAVAWRKDNSSALLKAFLEAARKSLPRQAMTPTSRGARG